MSNSLDPAQVNCLQRLAAKDPSRQRVNPIALRKANGLYGPHRDKTCLRGFPTKRDSNQSPQLQRLARKLKFLLKQVEI